MITRLQKIGDDYVLKIDPAMLKEMQIDENTPLEISQAEDGVRITKAQSGVPKEILDEAIRFAHENYSETFRKLAE